MSVHAASATSAAPRAPVTIHDLRAMKERGERFAMLTAYDASSAALLDELGVPVLLVGDSLGMVALGYDSTVPVTLDEMLHHTRAVVRGAPTTPGRRRPAVRHLPGRARRRRSRRRSRMLKEGGANAVKLEGGGPMVEVTAHLVARRHPGDGPPRPDAAVGQPVRRVQGPGAQDADGRTSSSPTRSPSPRPARSPSSSSASRRTSAARVTEALTSRPSASAPGRTATGRSSSGTTCSA